MSICTYINLRFLNIYCRKLNNKTQGNDVWSIKRWQKAIRNYIFKYNMEQRKANKLNKNCYNNEHSQKRK